MMKKSMASNRIRLKLSVCTSLMIALVGIALFAAYVCPYDPNEQQYSLALQAPTLAHPMGTDRYGRDMLSRVVMGSQVSVLSAMAVVTLISVFGTCVGVYSAYRGHHAETIIMRLSDVCLAFPGLVFAMAIAAVLQGGVQNAVLALAAISWPKYARLARGMTLSLRHEPYVTASKMAGSTSLQVIRRHMIPNLVGPIIVTAVLDMGTMMMEMAALSFLGLGAKPPTAEWGSMMSTGRSMLQTYPWVVLSPGIGMFIAVAICNVFGDTLRDYMDPKQRG